MKRVVWVGLLTLAIGGGLGSCGGGGGDAVPEVPVEVVGVFTGFSDAGNLDWENPGGAGEGDGGVGVGSGSDGDGGIGVGGDLGQFLGANVCVFLDNGTQLGCALTDTVKGMVTIKPGRSYTGGLRIELRGTATATYYEEGRNTYVPFPPERLLRARVPAIARNIGITPFTEAAFRLLAEGTAPESVGSATPTRTQVRAANERVRQALNEHFPTALHVDDIARLPFIKSQGLAAGSMKTDPRGRYGLVNGAFSKQASFHNSDSAAPTLDAVRQLAEDLLDGRIDGRNGNVLASVAGSRTYDPNTFTGELSSALAEQAARFGAQEALDALPKVVNYGNVRYEGYLFDGAISKSGGATSTVSGWVADNSRNLTTGQQFDRLPGQRALALYGNNGHGGGFYKADANGPRHKVFAIGDNVNGELALGTRSSTNAQAVEVSLPGSPSHIAGGFAHTLARMADGTVWAWGDNSYGQLGQNNAGLPNALSPLQVSLPVPAVAVAAASVASYALGADGNVYAWGSNAGFALLGNGVADGVAQAPVRIAGLSDVTQLSARDNDVIVLRRDNTVWHWGSHPADSNAFVAGDPSAPFSGGTRAPVQITGLPANVPVRKVITEQGLFAVLLANGHVYTWGIHFDITAGQVLRGPSQLAATRVLGLPPIRDMMPGGFQGYGERAFDRLTAMGVDYAGGMWKIRGRVGEVFDPDTESSRSAQRRPQGQGPRVDCEACHTFLDQPLSQLKALSKQPTTGTACVPPSSAHRGATASLIHAETDCVMCHNPARLNYPIATPSGAHPFAANGGWPDCVKPADLTNRTATPPAIISNACEIPPRHVFTPPGTVCASCHNSVLARPLRETAAVCAQPDSKLLPTIPVTATLGGAFTTNGVAIAASSLTPAKQHELRGTLSTALSAGQSLSVQRNGVDIGVAVVSGSNWTFSVGNAPDGSNSYRTRVTAGTGFGAYSNVLAFTVDATPPSALATPASFVDEVLGVIAVGGFSSDTTPQMNGTLSAALGAGETVQVLRNGAAIGAASVSAPNWSFVEAAALPAATYTYQARVIDAAGNVGTLSSVASLNIVGALPAASITQVLNDAVSPTVALTSGSSTADSTPVLSGTLAATLPAGHVVKIYRNTTGLAGSASVTGLSWSYTDPGAPDGTYSYYARVEAGAVTGTFSSPFALTIDAVAPAQAANAAVVADAYAGDLANGATTADPRPVIRGTISALLGAGEQVQILRNAVVVGTATSSTLAWTYAEANALANGTYSYKARVVDAAGNLGALQSTQVSVVVNTAAIPLQNALASILTVNGTAVASGGTAPASNVRNPVIAGTIQRAVNAATEVVRVYVNGAVSGTATVNNTVLTFSFTDSTARSDGTFAYRARIEQTANAGAFGDSNAVNVPIDITPPTQMASATAIYDNGQSPVLRVDGGNTSDASPRVDGTLSSALSAGDTLRVFRNGTQIASLTQTALGVATAWTLVDTGPTPAGTNVYRAQVFDAVGNAGPTSGASASATYIASASLPTANVLSISVSAGRPRAGSVLTSASTNIAISDTQPTISVNVSPALTSGQSVRVFRDGASIGTASSCASSCTVRDPGATEARHTYTARAEQGTALGTVGTGLDAIVDVTPPLAPLVSVLADSRPFEQASDGSTNGDVYVIQGTALSQPASGTTSDADPRLDVDFRSPVAGDVGRLIRVGVLAPVGQSSNLITTARISFSHPAALARPTNTPGALSTSSTAPSYRAEHEDAAGNVASTAVTLTVRYERCNAARARSRDTNSVHTDASFPALTNGSGAGVSCLNGCHTNQVVALSRTFVAVPATGFSPATNGLGQSNLYWCYRENLTPIAP